MPDTKRMEAQLNDERAALRAQLDALEARFSPANIVGTATDMLGTASNGAMKSARHNPGPLAVTGLGLVWMAVKAATAGSGNRQTSAAAAYDRSGRATATGLRAPAPPMAGFDARVAAAEDAMKADYTTQNDYGESLMTNPTEQSHLDAAKARAYQTAASLRARLDDGLDGLPDGAKEKIRSARMAAIDVQSKVETEAARAAQVARTTAHDNPLLVGALALASGAAIAAMLPRTQVEDRTIGRHRDRLFDEADALLREEKAKLTAVAEDAVAEGQQRVRAALVSDEPEKAASKPRVAAS